jgi:3-methylcrotonyl-CoA carboxylase beta subunit
LQHAAAVPVLQPIKSILKLPLLRRYDREGEPGFASARLWDDGVIRPQDTRMVLGLSLAAALNWPLGDSRFGVFRM